MDVDKILNKARKSIGNFCIDECKAYCCRKGHLNLKNDEILSITQGKSEELIKNGTLVWINKGNMSLNMGGKDFPCPSLDKQFKCTIHTNKKRPLVCKQFPIFLQGDTINFSGRCLAVRENMFYSYESKLIKLGYKIFKGSSAYDSGFYEQNF